MKILFISHSFYPEIGGIEINSEILANQFLRMGAEIKLVTWTSNSGEFSFDYEVIRNPSILDLLKLLKWSELVFENNPTLHISLFNVFFRKPRVVAIRTWIRRADSTVSFLDLLKIFWVNRANSVIAISNAIKIETCKKAIVIGNPYRSELFNFRINTNMRRRDFLFLGRLVSDKGADMCIELLYQLKLKYNKEYNLSIVGEGPELEMLNNMSINYNLDNNIQFLGFLSGEELVEVLNQHKYIIVPSRWEEPFGNVVLEGMACGCIPIVSDGGGLPDAVGEAGVLFERNSICDLIDKTYKLVTNKIQQEYILCKMKSHLSNHTEFKIAQLYFDVLSNAINSRK
jgi:glycosyltransferase involved in cell wall biosynthesis